MADDDWIEMAVFIHGITPARDWGVKNNPAALYGTLFANIQKELEKQGKPKLDMALKVIWNWRPDDDDSPVYVDQTLAAAERIIGGKIGERELTIRSVNWFHFFLWKLVYRIGRDIMLYGLGDAMYYVSKDGETTVREHVFQYLCDEIIKRLKAGDGKLNKISLTVLGHSAGSLIAHDFLYHLFSDRKPKPDDVPRMQELRRMIGGNEENPKEPASPRLRVRRLYTFGSPIAAWFIRANSLLDKVTKGTQLKLTDLGLDADATLVNPRWVNFWSLTDVAAFPLNFLYDSTDAVEDHYINVGWLFPDTHGAYWSSSKVAEYIAKTF